MPVNKRIGLGFTLSVDPLGGTSYTTIGAIVDGFGESEAKAMMVETAILTDVFITKSKSQVDPGEVTFIIAYDPDEASSVLLNQLLASVS